MLCHGFTQNAASWGPFGTLLGEHRTVVAVDLPGHGGSGHVAGSLEEAAEDILDLMGADPFDLVGYSMGGRVGLTMALRHPPSLRRLAMIGATAGLTSAAQRADRRAADERLALQLEDEGLELASLPAHVDPPPAGEGQQLGLDLGQTPPQIRGIKA